MFILFGYQASASIYSGPIGHREAYMASSGIALENSPGNLVLNPAGLSFLADKKFDLNITGNLVGFEQVRAETSDKTSDDMTYRTLLASGIYPIDAFQGYFAIYYMNPLDEKAISHTESTSNGELAKYNRESLTTSTVGGLAGGWAPTENLGYGISASLGFDIRDLYETLTTRSTSQTSLQYVRSQIKYYYVQLTPGVLWRPHSRWNVGAVLQLRPFAFYNDGAVYKTSQSSQGTDLVENITSYEPHIQSSASVGLGQKFVFGDNDTILLDLSYNPRFSFETYSGGEYLIANLKSASLGWQRKMGSFIDLMLGYAYFDSSESSTYLATLGFSINRSNNHVLFGLYYKNIAAKDTNGQALTGGFMFSSDILY